jgi:TP901 family phage tail tape measure protein
MSNKTLKASVVIGGTISGSFRNAMSTTKSGLKSIADEIVRVERKQRTMAEGIAVFGKQGRAVDGLRRQYAELGREADRLRAAQARLSTIQSRIDANNARRKELGGALGGAAATFGVIAASTFSPIRAAVQFENAMLGVAKQVKGARDDAGNLTPVYSEMARSIRRLGREIPIPTNQLAEMAAAGARMGVANRELMGFVRTSAMMADAFDMPGDAIADDMGKIVGLFAIPIPKIGDLADAINHLDDNAQSTAGGIIDVLRRIGGMAQTLKMPAREAAALGSTFLSLGSSAEVAGTASNAVMRILGAATAQSKSVRAGLQSIGIDPTTIQRSMSKDATGTILGLLDKLNTLNSEQRMVASTRIFGAEYGDDIAKLATGAAEYKRQLALVRSEEAKGSMAREFNARLKTTAAQWQITKNRASELGGAIGGTLLPAVNSLMGAVGPVVSQFAEFAQRNPGVVKGVIGTALAVSGLRVAALGVGYAVTTIKGPVLSVMGFIARWRATGALASMGRFGPVAMRVAGVVRTVGAAIAAIGGGPIAVVVGALTAGALAVRKYWQPIKAFMGGMWDGFASSVRPAMDGVMAAIQPFKPAWDAVSGAIVEAWDAVVKFLEPVTMSKDELSGVAAAGKFVGAVIANSFTTGIKVIGGVISAVVWLGTKIGETAGAIVVGFTSAWDRVKSVVGAAIDWIMVRMRPMLNAAGAVSSALGFGGPSSAPAAGASAVRPAGRAAITAPIRPPSKRAPAVTPAAPRTGKVATTVRQTNHIQIVQQPGESTEELARRTAYHLKRQEETAARGSLVDTV